MEPPKELSVQAMLFRTYYDVMSAEQRRSVFDSYNYDPRDETYHLKKNNMDEQTVRKLIWADQERT